MAAKAALTQKLRHGVGYLINRKTALVLAAWKRGLPRTKDLGGAASRFFADRHLSRAYEGWEDFVRMNELKRKSVAHMTNARFARGWVAWAAQLERGFR